MLHSGALAPNVLNFFSPLLVTVNKDYVLKLQEMFKEKHGRRFLLF